MSESNNPKPLSDRIFLIIMTKYDVLSNKVNPVWKRITKLDSDYQIVTRIRFATAVFFFLRYLYSILHRLSEHNFEYLKACTKEGNVRYIDLFIIEPCLCYDVACGFFFLFLLIDVGQKLIKRYKMTNNQFVFLLVLELSYGIVRGQSWNDYALTHFELWTSLYYADVIWLFGLYLIFFKCLMGEIQKRIKWTPAKITKEEKSEPNNIKGLLYDKKINEDNFQRKSFAEQLANRILATNNPEGSVAVAVTGEWASGKSTFLGYIKEYLEGKAIIIDMNPGATESKRLLVKDFFDTIAEELQSYDAAVSELVYDYVDSLLEVHENGIIKVLKKVFAFNKTNSTKERFKTLSECIKQLHQPLVIFIDDLDRLDKKETKEVLRLIRNTANFSRVIYIVAFDKDYVIAQIKTAHDETGKYLDKLFQLEISLPFYESNKITDYLFKVLEERYSNDKEKVSIGVLKSQTFIGDFVKSYRDVHRLINSFSAIHDCFDVGKKSNNEIDFCDLFLLEIIRLKHYDIYELVHDSGNIDNISIDYEKYQLLKVPQELEGIKRIIQFWKEHNKEDSTSTGGSIIHAKYFYRYFRLRYSDGEMSALELLGKLYEEEFDIETVFNEIRTNVAQNLTSFVSFASENVRPRDHIKVEYSQFERTFEIFTKLHNDYLEYYSWYEGETQHSTNEKDRPPFPDDCGLHLALGNIVNRMLNSKDNYYKAFLIKESFVDKFLVLIKQLLGTDQSDPTLFKDVVIYLKQKGCIEKEFSTLSKDFVTHYSHIHCEILEVIWDDLYEFILHSTSKISFKQELEDLICYNQRNLRYFIEVPLWDIEDSEPILFILQEELMSKVWGDKSMLVSYLDDKRLSIKNDEENIKPILQQLSTLLNESRPITEAVLREEQYRELRILEKEDEY
jgi:Cdc6-like AAA superfamily ATPase